MTQDPSKRKRQAIAVSALVALALTAAKLSVYLLTGSVALLSETLHSLTDLAAVTIAFVAVRRSTAPPHPSYRYGQGRAENLSALLEGVIVIGAAGLIVVEAVRALTGSHHVDQPLAATAVMVVAALAYVWLAWFLRREARELESPALEADSQHVLTDVYAAAGVAFALALVAVTGAEWLDAIVALGVAVIVVRLGWRLAHAAARVLLDVSLSDGDLDEIREVLQQPLPGVTGYHRLRSRQAGGTRHLDLHLTFAPNLTLERAHALASEVEHELHRRFNNLDVVIHLEPDTEAPPLGLDFGQSDLDDVDLSELPEVVHHDFERKFLLESEPDFRRLELLGADVVEIVQHYLVTGPDIEERVRRRFTASGESFYWTRKETRPGLDREIEERRLARGEYDELLGRADPARHPIRKTRYSFTIADNLYELDVFALPVMMVVLEVEMPTTDAQLDIPDFLVVEREVTNDPEFLNAAISTALARRQSLPREEWLAGLGVGDPVWVFVRSASSDTAGYGEVVGRAGSRVVVRVRGREISFDEQGHAAPVGADLTLERPGTNR